MPRAPKDASVADLGEWRAKASDAEKQSAYRNAPRQAYPGSHDDHAHDAMMAMMGRLTSSLAVYGDKFDELFADVDWGDDVDYGEDVVAPPAEVRAEAAVFLKRLARSSATKLGIALPLPEISPTVDGNIDLHWGPGETRELLLCVRGKGKASFFGKAQNGKTIKGSADTDSDNMYLAAWLSEK